MDGFVPLVVKDVERLTDDAVAVTFEDPGWEWHPGQHLTLRAVLDGVEQRRTYSLCGHMRVGVKRLEGGAFSSWVCEVLQPGDVVEVAPPAGAFGPRITEHRSCVYGLVGAGSGITPLIAIARTALEVEPESRVLLVYGNRSSRDVMFLDELADLKDRYPTRLQLLHVLSREEQESELLSGRLDRERIAAIVEAFGRDVDEWYLCGPLGVVEAAQEVLEGREVHAELFFAGEPPVREARADDALGATVTALLHGRSTTVETKRGTTLLDAVLRARSDAPYACKGGVCGTCRARLVVGEVEMAVNWALEPDELAAGVVLTCQARPTTERVSVEFL